jgi:uncharacterized protein (TIGR02118 family)
MVKAIALLKRKEGLSLEEFVEHYEKIHVPLILKYSTGVKRYVRNYVSGNGDKDQSSFDCITEIWYEDMTAYETSVGVWLTEKGQVIIDDEESFLDRSKIKFFLVNEVVSK